MISGDSVNILECIDDTNIFIINELTIENEKIKNIQNENSFLITNKYDGKEIVINNNELGIPTELILDKSLNISNNNIIINCTINTGGYELFLYNKIDNIVLINIIGNYHLENTIIPPNSYITLPSSMEDIYFDMFIEPGGIAGMDIQASLIFNRNNPYFVITDNFQLTSEYNNRAVIFSNKNNNISTIYLDESLSTKKTTIELIINSLSNTIIFINNTNYPLLLDFDLSLKKYHNKLVKKISPNQPQNSISIDYPNIVRMEIDFIPMGNEIKVLGSAIGDNTINVYSNILTLNTTDIFDSYNVYNIHNTPLAITIYKLVSNKISIATLYFSGPNNLFTLINRTGIPFILTVEMPNKKINSPIIIPNKSPSPVYTGNGIKFSIIYEINQLNVNAYIF